MSRRVLTAAAAAAEGVAIAVDALRANKIRATLTVLGIVTGVATVMVMAGVVTGVRSAVLEGIEVIGADSFVLERFDFTGQSLADLTGRGWERTPPVTVREAEMVATLPAIATASPVV
ncbi:MAG TPA: ABC transporter permease, partial [Longimicrobium sp.]|nr:ABC transporter permease [Longimicrobium sp.]